MPPLKRSGRGLAMLDISWHSCGRHINVRTVNGAYTLYDADAQARADILALLNALVAVGQGVGGGLPPFVRGWIND